MSLDPALRLTGSLYLGHTCIKNPRRLAGIFIESSFTPINGRSHLAGLAQDQLKVVGEAVTVMLQQFREHGDGGHAREGVDFVQQDLALLGQEEVDAREVGQFQLTERLEGILVDRIGLCLGQPLCLEAGLGVAGAAVLLFIGVELVLRHTISPG